MGRDRALATSGRDLQLDDAAQAASSAAIDTFVAALGGRDQLLEALAVGTDAPEVDRVVSLLLDPRYDTIPLKKLCTLANLTVVDLFAAYKSSMISRAHLQAYQTITAKLLPVVDDIMRRAAPYEVPCERCDGTGTCTDAKKPDAPPTKCTQCRGVGSVLQLPDLDRQKLALELATLVSKGGGIQIHQNTMVAAGKGGADGTGAVGGSSLLDLQQAVRTVLSGPRTPIVEDVAVEAEVVEVHADPPADV